jgi:photosystem II stability/assembly factor-like uncharacterized protein
MKKLLFAFAVLTCQFLSAQFVPQTPYSANETDPQWIQLLSVDAPNVLEVRSAFDQWRAANPEVKNQHTQYYKRWMRTFQTSMDAHGNAIAPIPPQVRWKQNIEQRNRPQSGNWEEMGPWQFDAEVAMSFNVQSPGACHVYTVEQAPSNPDVVWCGTATAGIWKSTDKGLHWQLMSRELPITSVYSIAIDPLDENTVYFGQGYGTIWKTTDGGQNWALTGDQDFENIGLWVRDLKITPDDNNVLLAATDNGLYRSEDAGLTWNNVQAGEHMEIEFHPTNPQMIYAVRLTANQTLLKRSENGGTTWATVGAATWPFPQVGEEQKRCEISVSPAEPDNVYVLASGNADGFGGLFGIYKSTDMGDTFAYQCCGTGPGGEPAIDTNPNLLGWSEGGEGDGGQYYYDLASAVSPTDPELMYAAGINVWRSEDSGSSWILNGHWVTWAGEFTQDRYTHADVHDIKFFQHDNGVDMWIASDGGLFYSSDQGEHIEPRMYGLHGTDFWGWQSGFKQGDVMVGGTYHNGTLIRNGDVYPFGLDNEEAGGWLAELGGDNFRGFVNPGDASIGYHDGGSFNFSDDRWTRITSRTFDNSKRPNTSYWWGEYGNYEWDPRCFNHMYSPVGSELWHSTNGGASWELIHDFGGDKIINLKVSPRDPNRIYLTHKDGSYRIWKSEDAGTNWAEITPGNNEVGFNNTSAKYIDVDGEDPDRMWFVILHTGENNKVYETTDGGENWQDLTTSTIGNQFVVSIAHQRGTDGGLFVGTNLGVFYRNSTMSDWEPFAEGLPIDHTSTFLQNFYCEGKIRVAGPQGVHQSDVFEPSDVLAGFTANKLQVNMGVQCEQELIQFVDNSVVRCSGTSYEWVFEGGSPEESSLESPQIAYSNAGSFDVTLTVTDEDGNTDTFTWENMITVVDEPVGFPLAEDFNDAFPPEYWKIEDPEGAGSWEHAQVLDEENNGVAQFPNYWVDAQGQTDLLVMPAMDFSNVADPVLFFDVSYQTYAEYIDGLAVWYKIDDAEEWSVLYEKLGSELAVDGNYTWFWYDLGGAIAWRTDTVNLEALAGASCVTLAFANLGGYGNHIWVDNVNLSTYTIVGVEEHNEILAIEVFPNPSTSQFQVNFKQTGNVQGNLYDMQGRLVWSETVQSGKVIDVSRLNSGTYLLTLADSQGVFGRQRVVIR